MKTNKLEFKRLKNMVFICFQISTKTEKHFFTSFAARDKTYTMLFKLWLNARLEQVKIPFHETYKILLTFKMLKFVNNFFVCTL